MDLSDLFTTWAENYAKYCREGRRSDVDLLIRWVEKNYAPLIDPRDSTLSGYCIEEPEDILRQEIEGCCPESAIILKTAVGD